ncbi:MAG: IPT/TIG domain-containing protein [Tannerella sp.]|jgi:hypothetical protein|nr:IPT/TIG domain-containing protein [Tannerella sp.]
MSKFRTKVLNSIISCLCAIYAFQACGDDESTGIVRIPYDPSQPVKVTKFFPDSGRIRDKVILEGTNFGTDPSKIRVWFNNKQAAVIGSTGEQLYAIVPRMPGDTCTVAIAVGDGTQLGRDSVVFEQKFKYSITVSVTTVCGDGTTINRPGALEQAQIAPFQMDVDQNGNIFVGVELGFAGGANKIDCGLVRINEEENTMELISNLGNSNNGTSTIQEPRLEGLNADKFTGKLYAKQRAALSYVVIDPSEHWVPRLKNWSFKTNPKHPEYDNDRPTVTGSYMGYNMFNKKCYTRFSSGHIAEIDPETGEGMIIFKTPQISCTTIGVDVDPKHPNMIYFSGYNSGSVAHGIWRLDLNDPDNSWTRLNAPTSSGYRDGPIEQAMFNTPYGLRFDMDGLMYISDQGNSLIRSYDPETGLVSTVLGIPGQPGFANGGREEAKFNGATSVGVDLNGNVYVADRSNRRIRKLAIE